LYIFKYGYALTNLDQCSSCLFLSYMLNCQHVYIPLLVNNSLKISFETFWPCKLCSYYKCLILVVSPFELIGIVALNDFYKLTQVNGITFILDCNSGNFCCLYLALWIMK